MSEIKTVTVVTDEGVASYSVGTQGIASIDDETYSVCGDPYPCFRVKDAKGNAITEIRCVRNCEIQYKVAQ